MSTLGARIKEIRESMEISQSQLAEALDISRPTLTQIENDKRKLTPEELKKLSEIFDISIDSLLSNQTITPDASHTEEQETKFQQLILYILSKVGAKYNVGKVVLYKLLYFSEFDYFEKYGKKLTGYPFIKLPMGPAPLYFDTLVNSMKQEGKVSSLITQYEGGYIQQRFIPNVQAQADKFSREEICTINEVLEKYSDYSAKEISEKSHQDKPWQMTKDMSIIDYSLIRFREYPFSPLEREKKKKEAQQFAKLTGFFDDLSSEPDLYEVYR